MCPDARAIRRHEFVGSDLERPGVHTRSSAEHATEDSPDIRVDRADCLPEGQRGHGSSCVRSDPRQSAERIEIGRHATAVLPDDTYRRITERQRSTVVAEAAPCPEDLRGRGFRQGRGCRELDQEARPGLGSSRGLRLLGHVLRDENRPRVARPAERQEATVRGVPVEHTAMDVRAWEHDHTIASMRFGAAFWMQQTDWPSLRDACLAAEQAGFDSLWLDDHLLSDEGDWHPPKFEGWTSLAALAALTTRPTLGLLVAANTLRNPGLAAKMAATIDNVSGGRFILGMGGGWFEREHEAFGFVFGAGFGERLDRLEEAIALIERLLAGEKVTHDGPFYRLVDAICRPLPIQARVPILIGGSGRKKTLRTTALHADLWNGFGEPERIAETSEVLRERCAEVGRDFEAIRRTVTMDVSIRGTSAEARASYGAMENSQGIEQARVGSDDTERGLNVGGPPDAVAAYVREFAVLGIAEVIWVFRSPFDLETMARLGEVRAAVE
jgi:alkanesulfonate monooxygenase SsuD/methylene tetrahydromethanopterin reductase-like flavin-dependent oxidoreductase (luciferase family)